MSTKDVLYILPQTIKNIIDGTKEINRLQEIRIRINKPVSIYTDKEEIITKYFATKEDMRTILQRISNYSIYAFEEELKQGYITIKGGHRIGLCGSCVIDNNKVRTIKSIAYLNIRICREVKGCSDKLIPYIVEDGRILNTILISPPKCGKTTLLRDICRNISDGITINSSYFNGKKVCVIDERGEIAGCCEGVSQMDVGIRTDVMDNCLKSEGIMMAIRSMAPEVIICDEIGTYKDVESILMAMNSGVNLITTIHGFGIEDLYKRPVFKDILDNHVFQRAIALSSVNGVGTVEYVYDFNSMERLWKK